MLRLEFTGTCLLPGSTCKEGAWSLGLQRDVRVKAAELLLTPEGLPGMALQELQKGHLALSACCTVASGKQVQKAGKTLFLWDEIMFNGDVSILDTCQLQSSYSKALQPQTRNLGRSGRHKAAPYDQQARGLRVGSTKFMWGLNTAIMRFGISVGWGASFGLQTAVYPQKSATSARHEWPVTL